MSRVLWVAVREFTATAATKGFIFGVLVTPAIMAVVFLTIPLLINEKPPKIDGELAVVDETGVVTERLHDLLKPEAIAQRRGMLKEEIREKTRERVGALADAPGVDEKMGSSLEKFLGVVPVIHVRPLPPQVDLEQEKDVLRHGNIKDGGRLALVVIPRHAVEGPFDDEHPAYRLFVRNKLDDRIEDEIRAALRRAIVRARLETRNLDPDKILTLTRIQKVERMTVTQEGERKTSELAQIFLPMGFMILLFVSSFSSGQYLLTTTIEEKSNRVVEILLSAVSPMELMAGKILGQLGVGFVILALYAGMGVTVLISFALLGLLNPWMFFYLVLFYLITYFFLGSLMAAIGAAVNDMREAQSLMAPVMVVVMLPWILWMPISRNPDSLFSVIASFVPPFNTFVMLLRMTSSTPPPLWQIWLSILVGAAAVYGCVWFAAKVFRVGLLMYGKPPDFRTLIRWVRMA